MPIEFREDFRVLGQQAFGAIAFEVMEQAFQVHNKLGRFFDEDAYQHELAHVLGSRTVTEAAIMVRHDDFCKTHFIDLLVEDRVVREIEVVSEGEISSALHLSAI